VGTKPTVLRQKGGTRWNHRKKNRGLERGKDDTKSKEAALAVLKENIIQGKENWRYKQFTLATSRKSSLGKAKATRKIWRNVGRSMGEGREWHWERRG